MDQRSGPSNQLHGDEGHAKAIVSLADHLWQLGRGIDMAWAWGELRHPSGVDEVLARDEGPVHRPSAGQATRPSVMPARSGI